MSRETISIYCWWECSVVTRKTSVSYKTKRITVIQHLHSWAFILEKLGFIFPQKACTEMFIAALLVKSLNLHESSGNYGKWEKSTIPKATFRKIDSLGHTGKRRGREGRYGEGGKAVGVAKKGQLEWTPCGMGMSCISIRQPCRCPGGDTVLLQF